jgi:hypothetical protein
MKAAAGASRVVRMKATPQNRLEISMSRACAISTVLGLALATGMMTAGSALAAPSAVHSATKTATVQSGPSNAAFDGWGGWGDWDDDGDCNGTANICA